MSLPPPTHQPWTWTITGFSVFQMLISFGVGPVCGWVTIAKSWPASHSRGIRSRLLPARVAATEVVSGAKRPPGTAQHDHPDLVVVGRHADRSLDLVGHRRHDRVEVLGPVQGDRRDARRRRRRGSTRSSRRHCPRVGGGRSRAAPGDPVRGRAPLVARLDPRSGSSTDRKDPVDRKWWTLGVVSVATFMLLLDITVVNVALPSIEEDLKATFLDLQWVVDAYALTLAAFVLSAGSLADRLGRRRVFAFGLVVFTIASLGAALSGDPTTLNIWRAIQGVGGAVMFAVSLVADRRRLQARPRARPGDGDLRCDDRRGRRDRTAGRRRAHRLARLGVDLPAQRADRRCRPGDHLPEARRVP